MSTQLVSEYIFLVYRLQYGDEKGSSETLLTNDCIMVWLQQIKIFSIILCCSKIALLLIKSDYLRVWNTDLNKLMTMFMFQETKMCAFFLVCLQIAVCSPEMVIREYRTHWWLYHAQAPADEDVYLLPVDLEHLKSIIEKFVTVTIDVTRLDCVKYLRRKLTSQRINDTLDPRSKFRLYISLI